MGRRRPPLNAVVVAFVLVAALWLQWAAISRQSFSGDGVYHLIAGHQALRYGHNSLNLEHPPLAKLVFALPAVMSEEALLPPLEAADALPAIDAAHRDPQHLFALGMRARWMSLVFFVLPLWGAAFILGRRYGGARCGFALMSMTALSFPWVCNAAILQTDTAAALGFLLTVIACYRLREKPIPLRAAALGLALGFALAVKHSAVLLVPVVVVVVVRLPRDRTSWRRRISYLAITALSAFCVLESAYALANLGPETSARTAATVAAYCRGEGTLIVGEGMGGHEAGLQRLAAFDPRLAQWLTGVVGIAVQNSIGVYPSYALGGVSYHGRWWYFPLLLAVKLPLVILILAAAGAFVTLRRRRWARPRGWSALGDPMLMLVVIYSVSAVFSNYNLGVRHMFPILPFVLLPVAQLVARVDWGWGVLAAVLALESVVLAPTWMSATNTWFLGAHNPSRFAFGAGNTEYRQSFFLLAEEVEKRGLDRINVLYPTLSEEVLHAYLPEAHLLQPGDRLETGWYAVNVTVEQYLPALQDWRGPGIGEVVQVWRPLWDEVRAAEDHGYWAGTFHVYRVLEKPQSTGEGEGAGG